MENVYVSNCKYYRIVFKNTNSKAYTLFSLYAMCVYVNLRTDSRINSLVSLLLVRERVQMYVRSKEESDL